MFVINHVMRVDVSRYPIIILQISPLFSHLVYQFWQSPSFATLKAIFEFQQFLHVLVAHLQPSYCLGCSLAHEGVLPIIELFIVQATVEKLLILQIDFLLLGIAAFLEVALLRIDVIFVICILPFG